MDGYNEQFPIISFYKHTSSTLRLLLVETKISQTVTNKILIGLNIPVIFAFFIIIGKEEICYILVVVPLHVHNYVKRQVLQALF